VAIPEERTVIPDATGIGDAMRAAGVDLVGNLWPMVPLNLLWGLACIFVAFVTVFVGAVGFALIPLLGIPLGGLFRAAARVQRGDAATFPDAFASWRAHALPSVLLWLLPLAAGVAFGANLAVALNAGDLAAAIFTALGFWSLLAATSYALIVWPLVVDPVRAGQPLAARLRLAAVVFVRRALRLLIVTAILAVLIVVGPALLIVLLVFGGAYVALAASRYVLPAADRIEGRATRRVPA
jgi:hypothetical protein